MAMLRKRAKRFLKNIKRKLNLNGNETVSFDKTNVECYNCHKRGHFARECRAPRAQDNRSRESTRRNVHIKTTNSSALVPCGGLGSYDYSDQVEEGSNYAQMAYSTSSSDSEISTDSNCSKTVETLKSQNEQMLKYLRTSKIQTITYKTGLKQIDPDDLEDMDLIWQMAMLRKRAKRFLKNIKRKLNLNGNETISFDKTNVECYNCHKRGHFARECRAPRVQDNRSRESTRRNAHIKTTNSSTLVPCGGFGSYDYSDQVEEGPNYALMAYSTSSLESIKARLLVYKKNESVYEEDIKLLKHEIYLKDIAITELRWKLELAQKQKDEIQLKVEIFENSSKSLRKLLDSQIADKCKAGLGYNVVPPLCTGNFLPPKLDLSSLEGFVNEPIVSETTVKKLVVETSEVKASEDKPKDYVRKYGHGVSCRNLKVYVTIGKFINTASWNICTAKVAALCFGTYACMVMDADISILVC
nr:hypothetical protein [Tanacetum cinerariifolium]